MRKTLLCLCLVASSLLRVTVLTDNNKATAAAFQNLTPSASGQLVLSIKSVNTYNYLNSFILTENTTSSAPLTGTGISTGTTEGLAAATKGSFQLEATALNVKAWPNPSSSYFTVKVSSKSQNTC